MPTITPKPSRKKFPSRDALSSSFPPKADLNHLVPFSCDIPRWVQVQLDDARGIATRAAIGRDALTKWAQARHDSVRLPGDRRTDGK